jgi:hypothetical protein
VALKPEFACGKAHFKDASLGWHSALPNDFVFPRTAMKFVAE